MACKHILVYNKSLFYINNNLKMLLIQFNLLTDNHHHRLPLQFNSFVVWYIWATYNYYSSQVNPNSLHKSDNRVIHQQKQVSDWICN